MDVVVGENGTVKLPKEIQNEISIVPGTVLSIYVVNNEIRLKPSDSKSFSRKLYSKDDFLRDLKQMRKDGVESGVNPDLINDIIKKNRKQKRVQ